MSLDIQYITLVNELELRRVEELVGADPRTIRIVARSGLRTAQRVLINDYGVDDFTIISDEVLIVNPPTLFAALDVTEMSFAVVTASYSGEGKARLLFGPTKHLRKVEGLQKLIQQIVKILLSNVGSNKFSPQDGGGLVKALGVSLSESVKPQIAALVSAAVSATEEQVRAAQTSTRGLRPDERLLSLSLGDIQFDSSAQQVSAVLSLMTFAGRSVSFPLTL